MKFCYLVYKMFRNVSPDLVRSGWTCPVRKPICLVRDSPIPHCWFFVKTYYVHWRALRRRYSWWVARAMNMVNRALSRVNATPCQVTFCIFKTVPNEHIKRVPKLGSSMILGYILLWKSQQIFKYFFSFSYYILHIKYYLQFIVYKGSLS